MGQTDINFSDIDAFRTAGNLPARTSTNFVKTLITGGGSGFDDGDEVEANLDLEWSNAVAPKANIIYVYAGASSTKNVFDAMEFAVDNNVAPIISTSYGNCEANLTGFLTTLQQMAQEANSHGQTITAASGDSGAADCDPASANVATHGLAGWIRRPVFQRSPELAAPSISGDAAGAITGTAPNTAAGGDSYWSGNNSTTDTLSSALSYIPETTWNDTTASVAAGGGLSATGGGKSAFFSKPSWQVATGVPSDSSRDVPDVSLSGSPNHDGFLVCSQSFFASVTPAVTSCATGFRASDGTQLAVVGGTSVGAPAFAGIVALLNQKTGSNGLGNINPTLYSLAASASNVFHDITTGDNFVPVHAEFDRDIQQPLPFQYGFSAGPGYDQVTGLGSVDVTNLSNAWAGLTPTPDFPVAGLSATASAPGQVVTLHRNNGYVQRWF